MALSTNKTIFLILGIFTVIGGAGAYYGYTQMRQVTSLKYRTMEVDRGDISQIGTATGTLTPLLVNTAPDGSPQETVLMQLEANMTSAQDLALKEGQVGDFSVDAYPDRKFTATLRQFNRLATSTQSSAQNPNNYKLVLDVDNTEMLLKPGMTGQVRLVTESRQDVLRLPSAALSYRLPDEIRPFIEESAESSEADETAKSSEGGRNARVYILSPSNLPLPVNIKVGFSNPRYTEIVGGKLRSGIKVIVANQDTSGNSSNNSSASAGSASNGKE
ncbi:MAG: hypothetical protein HYZ45_03175 [Burkholderiales bacterium]|nr:hypothetical protein [Burkholderiales bacterium]